MKKTIFTLIVCFACGLAYAEELTPIFRGEYGGYFPSKVTPIKDGTLTKYFIIDNSHDTTVNFNIYDATDFSLIDEIKFAIDTPTYNLFDDATNYRKSYSPNCYYLVPKQLIVVECNIKFFYTSWGGDAGEYSQTYLYDTQGKCVYDFGKYSYFDEVYKVAHDKLVFCVYEVVEEYDMWFPTFYSITFEPTASDTQNVQVEKKAAFPCPARGEVNIPTAGQKGNLRVMNLNGQTIDSQRIQEGDYQQVNTESYPAGTYIYQAGNETGKFMVE